MTVLRRDGKTVQLPRGLGAGCANSVQPLSAGRQANPSWSRGFIIPPLKGAGGCKDLTERKVNIIALLKPVDETGFFWYGVRGTWSGENRIRDQY